MEAGRGGIAVGGEDARPYGIAAFIADEESTGIWEGVGKSKSRDEEEEGEVEVEVELEPHVFRY